MKYKTFKYKNYTNCYFEVGNYTSSSMYIKINNSENCDLVVTVNMSDYFYTPNTATIKNYSEGSGMTNFLLKLGIIDQVYTKRKAHPKAVPSETIDFCEINIEKLKEYNKEFNYTWDI